MTLYVIINYYTLTLGLYYPLTTIIEDSIIIVNIVCLSTGTCINRAHIVQEMLYGCFYRVRWLDLYILYRRAITYSPQRWCHVVVMEKPPAFLF